MCGLGELKIAIIATALAIGVLLLDFVGDKIWPKPPKKVPDETEDVLTARRGLSFCCPALAIVVTERDAPRFALCASSQWERGNPTLVRLVPVVGGFRIDVDRHR